MLKMFAIAIVLLGSISAPATDRCALSYRQRVQLRGPGENTRAWLWNSVAALEMFNRGGGNDYFIFFHTRVLESRTVAVVTAACPHGNRGIIGVHVLSGVHQGANGFVNVRDAAYPPR